MGKRHGFCELHQRDMTGFTSLYCPTCVAEEETKARQSEEAVVRALERSLLAAYAQGSDVVISGPVANYTISRNMAGNDCIVGDIMCMGQLVRFSIVDPSLVTAFVSFGGTSRAVAIMRGLVRHDIAHIDATMHDVIVYDLQLKK